MDHAPERLTVRVAGPDAMRRLGARLGAACRPGDRFLLEGPFGAGKTTFVQGLASGLGVTDPVSSPSFVLENQYQGRQLRLYHIDLYRLERLDPAMLDELAEHLFGEGVAAVEWPEQLPAALREGASHVRFEEAGEDERTVTLELADERLRAPLACPTPERRPAHEAAADDRERCP